MSAYVGASYPEVAAHAVQSASQQSPSPVYGYLRSGIHQQVYLFGAIDDAHNWFAALSPPFDYAAVFAAPNLMSPVQGLESFGHSTYVGATDAELVNRATDDQFYAMYPERRHRPLNPSDPADRELIAVWRGLHRQTADRAQSLALAGDAYVGQWPLFLFLGAAGGGVAGYFLRRWQEQNPGRALPLIPAGKLTAPKIPPSASAPPTSSAGDHVGGPWLDIEPFVGGPWLDGARQEDEPEGFNADVDGLAHHLSQTFGVPLDRTRDELTLLSGCTGVGGPWLDVVGPQVGAWPETRALIESAKREAVDAQASAPAAAWVWSLDPSGSSAVPGAQLLSGSTFVTPFSSYAQALDYMRSRIQTPHVALAVFDTASPHWPNPVNWTKSDDPAYAQIIAQRASTPPRMAGSYGSTTVGSALDDLRARAEALAAKNAGRVIGVIHTSKDGLWHVIAFRSEDDADDWLDTSTQNPESYTYASYFNKSDPRFWPHAVIEKVSGMRSPPGTDIRRPATSGRWAA